MTVNFYSLFINEIGHRIQKEIASLKAYIQSYANEFVAVDNNHKKSFTYLLSFSYILNTLNIKFCIF